MLRGKKTKKTKKKLLIRCDSSCISTGTAGLCSRRAVFLEYLTQERHAVGERGGGGGGGIPRCYHISLTGFKEALFTPADTCSRVEPHWADGGKILQPAEPPAAVVALYRNSIEGKFERIFRCRNAAARIAVTQ